jgi:hypothetical protein
MISPRPQPECIESLLPSGRCRAGTDAVVRDSSRHPDFSVLIDFLCRRDVNPLASPGWRLERIREILCLVHHLAFAELHNAHGVCRPPLVHDCVFRDPEITFP